MYFVIINKNFCMFIHKNKKSEGSLPVRQTGTFVFAAYKVLYEPRSEKTGLQGFHQVLHKPGCTATEDG